MNFTVRKAEPQDIPALESVELSAAQRFDRHMLVAGLQRKTVSPQDLQASQAEGLLWVAEAQGKTVVGFLLATRLDADLHISEMSVTPTHGRQGVGAALLRAVRQHAKVSGYARVTLTTFASVPWNAPFYAKNGFREMASTEVGSALLRCIEKERVLGLKDRVAMCASDA